jgi:glucokinase
MADVIVAVDIGATKIAVSISNRDAIIVKVQQPVALKGEPDSIPLQVKDLIDRCLEKTEEEEPISVGVSSAGPFRRTDGMIELVSPNICGGMAPDRGVIPNNWDSVPLEKVLRRYYQNLEIENDAVSGVVAEKIFGKGEGIDNLLYVTWSTGIGTGAYVDGRLIKGKNGNAPHGGHIYLGLEGPTCGCGNVGDLEAWASGTSIANQYGGGVTTAEVFERYHEGDERAVEVVRRAAIYFGKGIASLNAVLDTVLITIGGSVFLNNEDLLLPMVRDVFHQSFPLLSREVKIEATGLGKHLGYVAAISLVIPDDWVEDWNERKPWEKGPGTHPNYIER